MNFGKNLQDGDYRITHHAQAASLCYLAKYKLSKITKITINKYAKSNTD